MNGLERFYEAFSAVVATPPVERSGHLSATPERFPAALVVDVADATGLEVYQRQGWLRLLDVLASEYPLTAYLSGPARFRSVAIAFLCETPPRSADVAEAADGFDLDPRVRAVLPGPALAGAAIDAAWRAVCRSPVFAGWRPSADEAARLRSGRLRPSPARRLVAAPWALIEARHALARGEVPRLPADAMGEGCDTAVLLAEGGVTSVLLEPFEARLVRLLDGMPLPEALARLEDEVPGRMRASLPAEVRRWLSRATALGVWSGVD
jgi:hypothetical protein